MANPNYYEQYNSMYNILFNLYTQDQVAVGFNET